MPVRPPRALWSARSAAAADPLSATLEQEILTEKRETYLRLMHRLERALARLEADGAPEHRDAAAEALWHVVVQRDIIGLRTPERFYGDLGVPRAVRLRMGIVRGGK